MVEMDSREFEAFLNDIAQAELDREDLIKYEGQLVSVPSNTADPKEIWKIIKIDEENKTAAAVKYEQSEGKVLENEQKIFTLDELTRLVEIRGAVTKAGDRKENFMNTVAGELVDTEK